MIFFTETSASYYVIDRVKLTPYTLTLKFENEICTTTNGKNHKRNWVKA